MRMLFFAFELGNLRAVTALGFFVAIFEITFKKLQNAENDCCDRLVLKQTGPRRSAFLIANGYKT